MVMKRSGLILSAYGGNNICKTLAYLLENPSIGIHHIEGHIQVNFISAKK